MFVYLGLSFSFSKGLPLSLLFSILLSVCASCFYILAWSFRQKQTFRQLLDDFFFVISRIIKVEVGGISRIRRLRLITLTEFVIIRGITKTESDDSFIIHYTK